MIYFAYAEEVNRVKIGITDNMRGRISVYKTHSPVDVNMAIVIENTTTFSDLAIEQALHKHFTKQRLHGEWFACNAELSDFVEGRRDLRIITSMGVMSITVNGAINIASLY